MFYQMESCYALTPRIMQKCGMKRERRGRKKNHEKIYNRVKIY